MATGAGAYEAIVLAAGAGRRFGGRKLLTPYGRGVLLDAALKAAFAAPVVQVTVVTGADGAEVALAAEACAVRLGRLDRLNLTHAEDYEEGMGASLRTAAAELAPDAAGVFVFLGDMPKIPPAVFPGLVAAVEAGAPAAAPVFDGKRGHPVLIGAGLMPGLMTLTGDAGARAVLQGLGERLALIQSPDDGVLFDVDQPGDLA